MEQKKPNIILIMSDQQRYDTIGAHGYEYMITPNLDKLAAQGTNYLQTFACGATCIPARAALFTGMYAHNTGIYTFNDWSHQKSWIHSLKEHGYHCVNIGKMHIQPRDESYAFDERIIVENPIAKFVENGLPEDEWGRYLSLSGVNRPGGFQKDVEHWKDQYQCLPWDKDENLHKDVFIGNSAISWIEREKIDKPVFLQIGFTGPHETYDPLKKDLDLYRDISVPEPVYYEDELDSKPIQQKAQQAFLAQTDGESQIDLRNMSLSQIKEMRRHYYANVTLIDRMAGKILLRLEEKGLLEDSLVIFTSDHGDMLGDHKLAYKWFMYDSSIRVPLIMVDTKNKNSSTVNRPVSHIDLGPTILKRAGIDAPEYLEGENLGSSNRQYVYCEDNNLLMIRNSTHKLVLYLGQEEGELYDLKADPGELVNLFDDSENRKIRLALEKQLLRWIAESSYKTMGYKNGSGERPLVHPSRGPFIRPVAIMNPHLFPFERMKE